MQVRVQDNFSPLSYLQRFASIPKVLATVRHSVSNKPQDAMNVWVEELKADYFRVCLREVKTFDGKHQNLKVASLTRIVIVHRNICRNTLVLLIARFSLDKF